jgi:hypothetical protein
VHTAATPAEDQQPVKQRKPRTKKAAVSVVAAAAASEAEDIKVVVAETTATATATTTVKRASSSKTIKTMVNGRWITTVREATTKSKPANPVISKYPLYPVTPDQDKYVKLVSWNVFSLNSIVEKGSLKHYIRYRSLSLSLALQGQV